MNLTPEQCRAARALLGWSQQKLIEQTNRALSQNHLSLFEKDELKRGLGPDIMMKIVDAFYKGGVEVWGDVGVRFMKTGVYEYKGKEGLLDFLENDVYPSVKDVGGEILVSDTDERDFDKWLSNGSENYRQKMTELKNINFKVLLCEGDNYFVCSNYCTYKWTPKEEFTKIPFYVYADKFAVLDFKSDDLTITVIKNKSITDAYRIQFQARWKRAITPSGQGDKKI